EIAPSPDFIANIERPFYDRSMMLQAWGAYGVLWPVVHQYLGVSPDLGRDQVSVVPQIPAGQSSVAGKNIALGKESADVAASRSGNVLRTDVTLKAQGLRLTLGAVLPAGAQVGSVTLNGESASYTTVQTARGTELHVTTLQSGSLQLKVTLH
ncbi:MAG: glycogen debranching protein, partial [Kribbellaceae bacterium]